MNNFFHKDTKKNRIFAKIFYYFMRYSLLGILIFLLTFSTYGQRFNREYVRTSDRIHTYQDHQFIFGKNNLSISFLPLIQRGIEIHYDRRIVERHWLKLAPVYFRMRNYGGSSTTDFRNVDGWGLKLQHKYFPYTNTDRGLGFFLSYGPGFQRFDITTRNDKNLVFDRILFECVIGFRKVFAGVLYFEFFVGLEANLLQIDRGATGNVLPHELTWSDYTGFRRITGGILTFGEGNYTRAGNFLTFGLNFGILF